MVDPDTSVDFVRFFSAPGRWVNPWFDNITKLDADTRKPFVLAAAGAEFCLYGTLIARQIFVGSAFVLGWQTLWLVATSLLTAWALSGMNQHSSRRPGQFVNARLHANMFVRAFAVGLTMWRHYRLLSRRFVAILEGQGDLLNHLALASLSILVIVAIAAVTAHTIETKPEPTHGGLRRLLPVTNQN